MKNQNKGFNSLSKKDKIDFYISIVVISLAALMILYFTIYDTNILKTTSVPMAQSEVIVTDDVQNDITEVDIISSEENLEEIEALTISGDTYKSKHIPNLEFDSANVEIPVSSESHSLEDINSDDEVVTQDIQSEILDTVLTVGNDVVEQVTEIITENSELVVQEEAEAKKTTIVNNDSSVKSPCIIIIGSYRKAKNVTKMMRKLETAGYNAFNQPYKDLTRVGMYLDCDPANIRKKMAEVRSNFASDAVLLVKE